MSNYQQNRKTSKKRKGAKGPEDDIIREDEEISFDIDEILRFGHLYLESSDEEPEESEEEGNVEEDDETVDYADDFEDLYGGGGGIFNYGDIDHMSDYNFDGKMAERYEMEQRMRRMGYSTDDMLMSEASRMGKKKKKNHVANDKEDKVS
jgi:ribosomal protein L32